MDNLVYGFKEDSISCIGVLHFLGFRGLLKNEQGNQSSYMILKAQCIVKPWSNGLAITRKLKTWVYLWLHLARPCVYLRSLWSRSNSQASQCKLFTVWPPNPILFTSSTCRYLQVRLTRALATVLTTWEPTKTNKINVTLLIVPVWANISIQYWILNLD